jgi:uncharacterized protein
MGGLFVDTWGWLALRDKGDRRHREAVLATGEALGAAAIVTTDYVLDETFTLLFRRLAMHKAKESVEFLMAASLDGTIIVAPIHAARFREAVRLRMKYRDKPEISFTDFTSMVVMQELGLKRILSEDRHFTQVGLGLVLVP